MWNHGTVTGLGTFGGGNGSIAWDINDWGQVVGGALNAIPDSYASGQPFLAFPVAQQYRAFLWQNGRMRDLGTLGGNDAVAALVNDLGGWLATLIPIRRQIQLLESPHSIHSSGRTTE